jgi:hypothetical protein
VVRLFEILGDVLVVVNVFFTFYLHLYFMHVILVVLPSPLYLRMHLLHLFPPLTLSLSTSHLISPGAYIPLRYYWLNPIII